jgi:hypothetical protein
MTQNRLFKKIKFLTQPKCLNGIKELNIECDGRAILCQMGSPGSPALTTTTAKDYDYDVTKFFNSPEVKDKRLNCQSCSLNCQQHIYFNPGADNIWKIFWRMLTAFPRMVYKAYHHR